MVIRQLARQSQRGMCTLEHAMGTVAACGFACVLFSLLRNWRDALAEIFGKALAARFGWQSFSPPW